jgi:flagellar biosynthesis/type III secretory pathway chaperone
VQQIMPHLDEANAEQLRATRQECITLVEELRALNRGNCGLIQTRLDRIEATLDFLSRTAVENDGHYTLQGDNHALVHTGHVLNWQA